MKKAIALVMSVMMLCLLFAGCGLTKDYSDCFSVTEVSPGHDTEENYIYVNYEVTNNSKDAAPAFYVTFNNNTKMYSLGVGNKKSETVRIDIGRPSDYKLSFPIRYEVKTNGKVLWTKKDTVEYDCTSMFVHKATVKYKDKTAQVNVTDYKQNYFTLKELFPGFDDSVPHNISIKDTETENVARILKTKDSDNTDSTMVSGGILMLSTNGDGEYGDTYRFADNCEITVSDSVTAASVKWTEQIEVSNQYLSRDEIWVRVENISDETVYAVVTKLYLNDTEIPKYNDPSYHFWVVSYPELDDCSVEAGSRGSLYNYYDENVFDKIGFGSKDIRKIGANVRIVDEKGKTVYEGVLWQEVS